MPLSERWSFYKGVSHILIVENIFVHAMGTAKKNCQLNNKVEIREQSTSLQTILCQYSQNIFPC